MPTNQQRRDAERRRLQRQLEERRAKEIARRRFTLIASVVGTVVVIAGVVIGIVVATSGDDAKPKAGSAASGASSPAASGAASSSAAPAQADPPAACTTVKASSSGSVSFDGVTISNGPDLKAAPKITAKGAADPKALECADVVVGSGTAAKSTSTVAVQYSGVLYKTGAAFDSSWKDTGKPVSFSLAQVVPGFSEGIGGAGKLAPMKVGGRRILILPSVLGYGSAGQGSTIPPNAPLVFVVDLTKVS